MCSKRLGGKHLITFSQKAHSEIRFKFSFHYKERNWWLIGRPFTKLEKKGIDYLKGSCKLHRFILLGGTQVFLRD